MAAETDRSKKTGEAGAFPGRTPELMRGQIADPLPGQNTDTMAGRNPELMAGRDPELLAGRNPEAVAGRNTGSLPWRSRKQNLFLIGFMGAGKSTAAARLRDLFGIEAVEMDELIEEREGMSIPAIFERRGEKYFRDAETALLIELQGRVNTVIACGGGTPMREENVAAMRKSGTVVLLTATPETILERLKDDHSRPLLEGRKTIEFVSGLMESRREKYAAAADLTVRTDGRDVLDICMEIAERLAS